ncbi:MbnP family protein [Longitalea luteola]|uniref:MbnP family protein n=1 Tax=Longitalea luteola TaxID=2812563 RepID=UPI001A973E7E|nr:MbnP family protein [Longitalea luteola]
MKLTQQLHRVNFCKLCIALLLVTAVISCQKELHFDAEPQKEHNLILKFKPVVLYDSVPLVLGQTYTNNFKEPFTPTAFKFYIHNFQMINTDSGKTFELANDKYYLVDFSDSASTEIKIAIQPYVYNRIKFTIGVDSADNVNAGAQIDALDPARGMFWNTTTGYIMAKLEGTSPRSPQGGKFEYHIGGFTAAESVIREIPLLFPYGQNLDLKPGGESQMFITCDANDWFYNPWDIKISQTPVVNGPGELARQVAENYSKMFTVDSVYNGQ